LALYFIYEGNSGRAVSPTKQAEFLSLGVPIITNSGIGDSEEILEKNDVGIIIKEFKRDHYQKAVEQIPIMLKKPKNEIVNIAEKYFNLEQGIDTYNLLYNDLNTSTT